MINRFRAYGFLKNLRFFEPYLILIFLDNGISYTQIGFLFSIRFLTAWLLEIPSGVIADLYSKKKAMLFSLSSYIFSFLIFYYSRYFLLFSIGMFFFGIGEAFRSGTHKGIIMDYLQKNNIIEDTHIVYSSTRSFSMLGSSLNALISIIIIIKKVDLSVLFAFSIIPYVICLLLLMTYPEYSMRKKVSLKKQIIDLKEEIVIFMKKRGIIDYAATDAFYKSLKEYIQPVILISFPVMISVSSHDKAVNVGIIYFVLNLINAFSSKMSKKLKRYVHDDIDSLIRILGIFLFSSILLSGIFLFFKITYFPVLIFILMYVFYNLRKPVFVSYFSLSTASGQRTSILSTASFLSAIISAILSPFLGLLADQFGVALALISVGIIYLLLYYFISVRKV